MIQSLTGFSFAWTALLLAASLGLCSAGCGGDSGAGEPGPDAGTPGSGDPGDDDDRPADAGGDDQQALDPAACATFASSMASAASDCGSPLPAGGQQAVQGWCEDGIEAAQLCGGDPAGGFDCFSAADSDDWVCSTGEPYPSCGGDAASALGMYCVMALGNPACASGIGCDYDADCSSGSSCNTVTGQCFSDSGYCVGLPCGYDADCPAGHTCNGAEGACIRE